MSSIEIAEQPQRKEHMTKSVTMCSVSIGVYIDKHRAADPWTCSMQSPFSVGAAAAIHSNGVPYINMWVWLYLPLAIETLFWFAFYLPRAKCKSQQNRKLNVSLSDFSMTTWVILECRNSSAEFLVGRITKNCCSQATLFSWAYRFKINFEKYFILYS